MDEWGVRTECVTRAKWVECIRWVSSPALVCPFCTITLLLPYEREGKVRRPRLFQGLFHLQLRTCLRGE